MTNRPWYRRYGSDFVVGTMALSLEEKGAYSLCLDLIYDRGRPIPDDARWLAGICGVSVRKWKALRESLISAEKLIAADGFLTNRRFEAERAKDAEWRPKSDENAAKTSRKLAENLPKGSRNIAENEAEESENSDLASRTRARLPLPLPLPDKTLSDKSSRERRGKRIPEDWAPSEIDLLYAAGLKFERAEIIRIAAKFRNYWLAAAGKNAAKVDWSATWRNWLLREAENKPQASPKIIDRFGVGPEALSTWD